MFLGGRSFELEHDGYRYPEGSCAVFYQGGFVIIGGFESRKVERWILQEILNFYLESGMKQTAITLDSFLTLINILGCNITPVPPLYQPKESRLTSILTSKFSFLSNRACWPLEVIAILQTISRLLNCIYRQLISGQMEENYQGNYKPHEIIAILCLFLISNFRKGRLLYIPQVGWSIGRSAAPLIFSSDFLSLNLIHPICLIHPIHNHSTTTTRIAKDYPKGPASCK